MAFVERSIFPKIVNHKPPKALVIFGPRRIGKTTILQKISNAAAASWYTGDSLDDVQSLNIPSTADLRTLMMQSPAIIIDEAQRVPDVGLLIKRLVDINTTLENPISIYVTGSSSLELSKGVQESALGRIHEIQMWPFSVEELANNRSWGHVTQNLPWNLVYGMYPEICTDPENAKLNLMSHCSSLLFKDVFSLSGIRRSDKFEQLVQYLAYNIGSLISYDGVAKEVGISKNTVAEYVTLLEQCFVIKVCTSFSKNLSNELKKSKKIYFYDNGIRNAIINDFSPIATRQDVGALWENFVFAERLKAHSQRNDFTKIYFWRTSENRPRELNFIEVTDGKMMAIECKTSPDKKANPGDAFHKAYPDCEIHTVSPRDIMKVWQL